MESGCTDSQNLGGASVEVPYLEKERLRMHVDNASCPFNGTNSCELILPKVMLEIRNV